MPIKNQTVKKYKAAPTDRSCKKCYGSGTYKSGMGCMMLICECKKPKPKVADKKPINGAPLEKSVEVVPVEVIQEEMKQNKPKRKYIRKDLMQPNP